jgi:hypothetical protein
MDAMESAAWMDGWLLWRRAHPVMDLEETIDACVRELRGMLREAEMPRVFPVI